VVFKLRADRLEGVMFKLRCGRLEGVVVDAVQPAASQSWWCW
jgi:hypothetical protein